MYANHARSPGMPLTFQVNLDLDPSQRWNEVVAKKKTEVSHEHLTIILQFIVNQRN